SQRHWHSAEDEFVHVLEGEVVLVTSHGEEILRAGDSCGFPAGEPDGHHLQNRSQRDAVVLEVGSREPDKDPVDYPDIDLKLDAGDRAYRHRDGTKYYPGGSSAGSASSASTGESTCAGAGTGVVGVTRQIVLDRSSATINAPRGSTVTPTGRPRVRPSSPRKPLTKSTGSPVGRPFSKRTNTTL